MQTMSRQPRWGSALVRSAYSTEGWSDPGEALAVAEVLPLDPGACVLDVGVGGGRTTTFLAPIAAGYVGIDIDPQMVRLAQVRHPGVDIRVGDARNLASFRDESFDLVMFSLNGIDCLDHGERAGFLAACHRILRPGGALLFSTHNLDGPTYGARPSTTELWDRLRGVRGRTQLKALVGGVVRLALAHRYHRTTRSLAVVGDGWAMAPLRSHEFRFVVHFTRHAAQVAELKAAGFTLERAWTRDGRELRANASTHDDHYAHLVCLRADRPG